MPVPIRSRIVSYEIIPLVKDGKQRCELCKEYAVVKLDGCETCQSCGAGKCSL